MANLNLTQPVDGRIKFPRGTYGTLLTVADTLYAFPIRSSDRNIFVDRIGLRVTTAGVGATPNCRMFIFADNSNVVGPGQMVAMSAVVGGLDSVGGKFHSFTPSVPLSLSAGSYWAGVVFQSAGTTMPTVAALAAGAQPFVADLGVADFVNLPSSAAETPNLLTAPLTFANSGSLVDAGTLTWTVAANGAMPLVGMRTYINR